MRTSQSIRAMKGLSTKKGRMQVYSCAFCEFVQTSLDQDTGMGKEDEEVENSIVMDKAFEAKYLFHVRTVHGIER